MISLAQLKEVESSLLINSGDQSDDKVTTICSLDNLQNGAVIFIKDKKYYKALIEKLEGDVSLNTIGVVFQEKFFVTLTSAEDKKQLEKFRFHATVNNVDLALSRISKVFYDVFLKQGNDFEDGRETGTANVHTTSSLGKHVFIGQDVEIGANVVIHAGCVILSYSKIGDNTVLYPNVTICRNVRIGKDCRVHGNTTIGSDGYGYNYFEGEHLKVWHFGGVDIGDSVEVGSGTSIDQGTFSPTIIGNGTKIDNQVHLAHNCKIGKGVLITGQAGFSGSVTLCDYVAMGGCAQFAPGVVVGKGAQIGGIAGVTGNVPEKAVYAGYPARPIKEWLKASATLRRLALGKKE